MIWKFIFNSLFLIFQYQAYCSGSEHFCLVLKGNLPGYCIKLNECETVYSDVKKGLRNYTTCNIPNESDKGHYVCCPNALAKDPNEKPANDFPLTRKHQLKCNEYQKAVFSRTKSIPLPNQPEVIIEKNECGHKAEGLIVGGTKAKPREFPHMVSIGYIQSKVDKKNTRINMTHWDCGGSLLSERYVLTASHCFHTVYGTPQIVRAGELDFSTTNEESQVEDIGVEKIIYHPKYNPITYHNDIGLIKLNKDIELTPWKRPICLPSFEKTSETDKAIATGWGHTFFGEHKNSDHLLKVVLEKFTYNECSPIYEQTKTDINSIDKVIEENIQICYGSHSKDLDTCQGDSGGPLQIYYNHKDIYCMYEIIGITSFGITCGKKNIPAVYTKVFNYVDWIENIVW